MKSAIIFLIAVVLSFPLRINAQNDSTTLKLQEFQLLLKQLQENRSEDSLKKVELQSQYNRLKSDEHLEKIRVQAEFRTIEVKDSLRKADMIARANYLRKSAVGYPVTLLSDTLFYIYTKIGATTPEERAVNVTKRVKNLYDNDFFNPDSLISAQSENTVDIIYGDLIVVSISELDALINNSTKELVAANYITKIRNAISVEREKNTVLKLILRLGLMILVVSGISLLIWLIGKGYIRTVEYITKNKDIWLKSLSYKDYTFLNADQELKIVYFILKLVRWFLILVLLYLVLPLLFSIFPFTRGWANMLLGLVWSPLKGVLVSIWAYLPNLFSILVIYFVMKYVIRFVKYIFSEIEAENLKLSGFHPDWAKPTFGIIKFLLYAFMFVLIFPYLPGSNSQIFKGVSVFLGVIFSLGSSSAIANMVAGLVITYMRPFKIGDRIKIGEITGDVIEKNMLVTRIRTIKNEEITIPNSAVLSGNTTNFSSISKGEGLIVHTTVTIGYDVAWRDMHQALIDAALRTDLILKEPEPFVLQTSLDDFYVSYQINAYTREASKQAVIYSNLHQNIQDVCFERGIEILSPHYRSARDGNMMAIPDEYLPKDYESPGFNINLNGNKENKEGN
jgi:small-conductance mechanosensitive channel